MNKRRIIVDDEVIKQVATDNRNSQYDVDFENFVKRNKGRKLEDLFSEVFKKHEKLIEYKWYYEKKVLQLELNKFE